MEGESVSAANPTVFPPEIRQLLDRVAAQLRIRYAERMAWRGAIIGGALSVFILMFRTHFEELAIGIQVSIPLVTIFLGCGLAALIGFSRKPTDLIAARFADQAFHLGDRLATVVEQRAQHNKSPLMNALLMDARCRATGITVGRVIERDLPKEAPWMGVPIALICALLIAPPLPSPETWLPEQLVGKTERDSIMPREERARLFGWDFKQKESLFRQEAVHTASAEKAAAADSNENFKDRSTNKQKSDFASFLQKGDERLKLLERTDRLPDLQSDFASSKYRMLMQKNQELTAGNNGQMSAKRLEQILREMQKMGKRGNSGEWNDEVNEGLEALQDGQVDQAMSSMQSALSKLRAQEEKERNSRRITGSKENSDQGDEGSSGRGSSSGDQDRIGYSSGGQKTASQGKATPRLRSTPYDAALEGQRKGRQPTVETGQTTRPASVAQQLQTLGDLIQYRRQAEDAITREQVPRDYHDQIRDYFKSLQE
jgi:hypothetical protein